jgi:hypothetical protein
VTGCSRTPFASGASPGEGTIRMPVRTTWHSPGHRPRLPSGVGRADWAHGYHVETKAATGDVPCLRASHCRSTSGSSVSVSASPNGASA